jgi:hypothetical protein
MVNIKKNKNIFYIFLGLIIIVIVAGIAMLAINVEEDLTYCEDNIIPNQIIFLDKNPNALTEDFLEFRRFQSTWKDGTQIKLADVTDTPPGCVKGKYEGENVNNLYCDNLLYEKISVDNQGRITESTRYYIELVLEGEPVSVIPTGNFIKRESLNLYNILDYTCTKAVE